MAATRVELNRWIKALPQPWTVAMEATIFTGWIRPSPPAGHREGRASGDATGHCGGEWVSIEIRDRRATLAVARKLLAYLLAVDRRGSEFVKAENQNTAA